MRRTLAPRSIFALLAALSLLAVLYASAIPMRTTPLTLQETWQQFLQIRWLDLGLPKRADWVANGIVFIPFGFFYAAAFQGKSSSLTRKQLGILTFAVLQLAIVIVIEMMQSWFPPRVQSINDMAAGYLGGIAGLFLWYFFGGRIVAAFTSMFLQPKGFARFFALLHIALVGLLLYALMPLDVMLTPAEWSRKLSSPHFTIIPFADLHSPGDALRKVVFSGWALVLGLLLAMETRSSRQGFIHAAAWCVAFELLSLPIFSARTSVTDVIVRLALAFIGAKCYRVALKSIERLDTAAGWLCLVIAWTFATCAAFLLRYEAWVQDRELIAERLWGIFAVPFARAQKAPELVAAQNILGKMAVFALLGFLLAGWLNRKTTEPPNSIRSQRNPFHLVIFATWVLVIAVGIEVLQAFLLPFIADITDVILYCLGAAIGAIAFALLIPDHPAEFRQQPIEESRLQKQQL